jgi:hypothetical protein
MAGEVEGWKGGGVEGWKDGGMVGWRDGREVARTAISFHGHVEGRGPQTILDIHIGPFPNQSLDHGLIAYLHGRVERCLAQFVVHVDVRAGVEEVLEVVVLKEVRRERTRKGFLKGKAKEGTGDKGRGTKDEG